MRRLVPYLIVGFALVALAIALLIVLAPKQPTAPPSPDDADIAAIAKACAVGGETESSSSVEAGIKSYFRTLHSGAKVSTKDVGAIAAKIASNAVGVEMYQQYTNCLQQQMTNRLIQRGIVVSPLAGDPDDKVADRVSMITPDTPAATLEDVAGKAISSGPDKDDRAVRLTRYQYKYALFIADFWRDTKRIGLGLATNEPGRFGRFGDELDFGQIAAVKFADTLQRCEGKPMLDAKNVLMSGVCGGNAEYNDIYSVYFFSPRVVYDDCPDYQNLDVSKCPKLGELQPFAVAMAKDQRAIRKVAGLFDGEINFGEFAWLSPEQAKKYEDHLKTQGVDYVPAKAGN